MSSKKEQRPQQEHHEKRIRMGWVRARFQTLERRISELEHALNEKCENCDK